MHGRGGPEAAQCPHASRISGRRVVGMDPAETLRQALRNQHYTHMAFQEAKTREMPPGESPQEWSKRIEDLRVAAEEADAEMKRLRPEEPLPDDTSDTEYQPPVGPGLSN